MYKIRQIIYLVLAFSLLPELGFAAQTCTTLAYRTTPTERFTNNGDETVTDKQTGLMWQHCLDGLSGTDCMSGTLKSYTWSEALQRAVNLNNSGGFANHLDWRLPNIKELMSLVETACTAVAINLEVFPNVYSGDWHAEWSSTPYAGPMQANFNSSAAFVLQFGPGSPRQYGKMDPQA
ncbi:MAG TPA: DUF1566 domain-containing protein, partial [Thiolinea sp.]|nr:DUF1566 domain-containing protein [Thiolinea sp.]